MFMTSPVLERKGTLDLSPVKITVVELYRRTSVVRHLNILTSRPLAQAGKLSASSLPSALIPTGGKDRSMHRQYPPTDDSAFLEDRGLLRPDDLAENTTGLCTTESTSCSPHLADQS